VNNVSAITNHLHLNVPGPGDKLLHKDRAVAKGRLDGSSIGLRMCYGQCKHAWSYQCLGAAALERFLEILLLVHHAHATATAAEGGLHNYRVFESGDGINVVASFFRGGNSARGCGHDRQAVVNR